MGCKLVEAPISSAFAALLRVKGLALGLFLTGLTFIVTVSLWLAEVITSNISRLQKGAEVFGSLDLSHRIQISTRDELEQLASAFNTMAEKLQKRSVEIENAKLLA